VPIPVAERSRAWVCGRLLAGNAGSNPVKVMNLSLLSVVCCQVEVSANGRSLVQVSPLECGVFDECDREAPIMRKS
jgi:hypothetical protein